MSESRPQTRIKDGHTWRIGADEEVAWINDEVTGGLSITGEHPADRRGVRTLAFPLELGSSRDRVRLAEDRFDDAMLRALCAHTEPQPWWLGFLDTGASDVVLDDAPRVRMYSGWNYVLVQAGPHEARTWRSDEGRWFTALPELMFPADRSWLVSSSGMTSSGDGGSAELISALLNEPECRPGAEKTDPSFQICGRRACPRPCTSG